jgi:hypothetical protein
MSALLANVEAFNLGQKVQTSFGPGIISAISRIDSIIYVTLSKKADGLYLFRPEQVEALGGKDETINN